MFFGSGRRSAHSRVGPPEESKLKDKLLILVAEDDPSDLALLERAIVGAGQAIDLQVTRDGDEMIGYLQGEREFSNRQAHPLPDIMVLDLKMPRMGGLEVLQWLRERHEFALIPKIILSGSSLETDVEAAYRLGANTFFTKPGSFLEFRELMQDVIRYWSRSLLPVLHQPS